MIAALLLALYGLALASALPGRSALLTVPILIAAVWCAVGGAERYVRRRGQRR